MKSVITKSVPALALVATSGLLLSGCAGGAGGGSSYPQRTISIVVPVPAGSSTDLATRLVVPCLEKELGQTIVVENREGGSGAIGNGQFVRARADGYTLVSTTAANAVLPEIQQGGVGFDASSFRPVGMLGQAPLVLITSADSEIKASDDLLKGSGKSLIGIPGATSVPGIVLKALIDDHGASAQAVPFDGNGGTVAAVLSGEVDAALVSADNGVVLPRINDGQIKAIATAVDEPIPTLPDVPTLASAGYDRLPYANSFWFLATQTETSDDVVTTLGDATKTCMSDSDVKSKLGKGVAPETFVSGDEVSRLLKEAQDGYAAALKGKQ